MTTYTGTNTTLLAYEATADAAADLTNTQKEKLLDIRCFFISFNAKFTCCN